MESLDVILLLSTALSLVYSCVCFFGFNSASKEEEKVAWTVNPQSRLLQIPDQKASQVPTGSTTRRRTGHLYVQRKW
jgi:hypothetical protein